LEMKAVDDKVIGGHRCCRWFPRKAVAIAEGEG